MAAPPFAAARRIRLETWHWPLLAGLVACLLTQLAPGELIADGDTHLHIAMGRWILAHHAIPFRDAFSFTFPGKEWVPHEWGGELILAAVYGVLGWGGVIAVTELALFASVAILTRFLLRYLVPRRAAIAASIAFTVAEPHILARPHLLAFPVMVLWMSSIVAARDEGRVPSLKLLPVMILWANLHAGFMIGLAFAGFLALEALIDARPGERIAVARRWGVFLALAGLSSLVSPNGIDVYVMTLKLVQMGSAMSMISEWQAADFSGYQPIEIWLVAFLLVALSA